jgi:RNA polymerase sigma-70 factor (sigma-E family)
MTAEPAVEVDAFDGFCRRVHPRLVGALSLYCGDAGAAEDFAQEALARAYRDWSTVAQLSSPEAWVHRVGMNLAHSWYRRLARGRRAPQAVPPAPADHDDALALRRAVGALPRRQRQAVVIRYFLDWSVADTADVMGCAEGTVRALTAQALAALRAALGATWEDER